MRKSDANLIEQAKNFRPDPGYAIGAEAAFAVAEMFNNDFLRGFGLAYAMGFIKGQRAEKARRAAK